MVKIYKPSVNIIKIHTLFTGLFVLVLALNFLMPSMVLAAALTSRKLTLGSSAISGSTTHKFDFNLGSTHNVGSIRFNYCTTASGGCTTPTGMNAAGATISAQSGATGFSILAGGGNTDANNISITRTAASVTSGTAMSYTFASVVNTSTANSTFYIRITTYTGTDASTGPTDTGVTAASTASQITLTGNMDESLVFCVGTSITGQNCGTISGSSINFGTFSSTATSSGSSVMAASTNGVSGYAITINGTTMTCATCSGTPTIAALSSQTASSTGTAQFGTNLVANTVPSVGANVSGSGSATATATYGTANQFRFVTADTVASVAAATNANTFTVSYIVNVPASQAAGTYTATMTYIATATY